MKVKKKQGSRPWTRMKKPMSRAWFNFYFLKKQFFFQLFQWIKLCFANQGLNLNVKNLFSLENI